MEPVQAKEKTESFPPHQPMRLEPATRRLALVSAAAGILAVTLFPVRQGLLALVRAGQWPEFSLSDILLRTRYDGISDPILNVLLFLPLGCFAVDPHLPCRRPWRRVAAAGLAGALFSAAIEFVQSGVPGRWPSLLDIAANGSGAALGAWLLLSAARLRAGKVSTGPTPFP